MKTILFQGDSITDCGRNRDNDLQVGSGYPLLIKAQLGYEEPEKYNFLNRGISGDRIVDLYARIKRDVINLKPDYLSILMGINDVWHEIKHHNGVDAEKFEKIYRMLIEEIKEVLPDTQIMILEPFCLRVSVTGYMELREDEWKVLNEEVKKRAEKAKKVAEEYQLVFIPLQDKFDQVSRGKENKYWLSDGVHPTPMGHELIKREWMKAFVRIS